MSGITSHDSDSQLSLDAKKTEPVTILTLASISSLDELSALTKQNHDEHAVRAAHEYQLSIKKARIRFLECLRSIFEKTQARAAGKIEIRTIKTDGTENDPVTRAIDLKSFGTIFTNILNNLEYIFDCNKNIEHSETKKPPLTVIINGYYLSDIAAEIVTTFNSIDSIRHRIPKRIRKEFEKELCDHLSSDFNILCQQPQNAKGQKFSPVQTQDILLENIDTLEAALTLQYQEKTADTLAAKKARVNQLLEQKNACTPDQYQELDDLLCQIITPDHDPTIVRHQHKILIEQACLKFLADLEEMLDITQQNSLSVISDLIKETHNDPNQSFELLPSELALTVKNKIRLDLNKALLEILHSLSDLEVIKQNNLAEKIAEFKKSADYEIINCQKYLDQKQLPAKSATNNETEIKKLFELALQNNNAPAARLLLKHGAKPNFAAKNANDDAVFHLIAKPLEAFEPPFAYQDAISTLLESAKNSRTQPIHQLFGPNKDKKTALAIIEETAQIEEAKNQQAQARYIKISEKFKSVLEDLYIKLAANSNNKKHEKILRAKIDAILTGMNQFALGTDFKTVQENLLNNEHIVQKRNRWSFLKTSTFKKIENLTLNDTTVIKQEKQESKNETIESRALAAACAADQSRNQRIEYLLREKKCRELLLPIKTYLIKQCNKNNADYYLLNKKLTAVKIAEKSLLAHGEFSQEKLATMLGAKCNRYAFWKPTSLQLLENAPAAEAAHLKPAAPAA